MQCFGAWYNTALEEELNRITDDDIAYVYEEIRDMLRSMETPVLTSDSPKQLAIEIEREGMTVIYRGKIREHIDELMIKLSKDGQLSMDELFGIMTKKNEV